MSTKLKVFLGILALATAFNTLISYRYIEFRVQSAQFFAISTVDLNDRLSEIQARQAKRLADEAAKAVKK